MSAECPKCGHMASALFVLHEGRIPVEASPVMCDRCVLELQLPPGYALRPDTRRLAPGRGGMQLVNPTAPR